MPQGYSRMPDTSWAYRVHYTEIRGPNLYTLPPMVEECAKDDPLAQPAFLDTPEKIEFAQTLLAEPGEYWIGIRKINADNEYGNVAGDKTVALQEDWFLPWAQYSRSIGLTCVRMIRRQDDEDSLDINGCTDWHYFICEYDLHH